MSWIRNNLTKKGSQVKYTHILSQITSPSNVPPPENIVKNTLNNDIIDKNEEHSKYNCLDYIDAILYINLEHRKDRNEHCLNEIRKIDPTLSKTHRIDAVCNKSNGALGCSLSHIKALNLFINNPSWNNIMLIEDDFTFISNTPTDIHKSISNLFKNMPFYDVFLLATGHNDLKTDSINDLILKVNSSQTTSGYIVTRNYAYTLLANYIKSSNKMINFGLKEEFCLDQFWKRIMPFGNWYTLKNRIGYQYGNYSDIEKRNCDYRC